VLTAATAVLAIVLVAVGIGSAEATTSSRSESATGATHPGPNGSPCALASVPPRALQHPNHAPTARPLLRRLASRLRPQPSDAEVGRFAFARLEMKAADSTFEGPCVVTVMAHADEQRWRADDGSGQVTGTPWHTDPTDPPAVETTVYRAGELRGVVPGPVPTDPAALAAALDSAYPPVDITAAAQVRPLRAAENVRQIRHTGTAARVRAIAELNAWHYTNKAARRAVLLVLADVHRLVYRGSVAGYPGAIAVSVDTADWRDVLVLDPRTGAVLAYEQVLLRNGQQLGVRTPYMNARTVYTGCGRSPRAGVAPSARPQ